MRRRRFAAFVVAAAVATAPGAARADDPDDTSPARRALGTAAAIFPGVLVHGTGSLVAGDRGVARKLRYAELLGLGVMLLGGIPMGVTGAARGTTGMAMPFVLVGGSVFLGSWMADVYSAALGGRGGGAPRLALPRLEARLGYAYVHDPQFDYASFAAVGADLRLGRWRVSPDAWLALDDDTQRTRLAVARRLVAPAADGSFVDLETAATWHRAGDLGYGVVTGELGARGRYDMRRLDARLAGSFVELSWAIGVEAYTFDGGDATFRTMQVASAAYGVYLGDGRGELALRYDHRHDDLAGGLGSGSTFDGPWGHFGLGGFYLLTGAWGVELDFEAGAAHVARAGVRWSP